MRWRKMDVPVVDERLGLLGERCAAAEAAPPWSNLISLNSVEADAEQDVSAHAKRMGRG